MAKTGSKKTTRQKRQKRRRQRGEKFDIQKAMSKTGIEFIIPGYQYAGPGTRLEKRLARKDPGKSRLDRIAKVHDIAHSHAKT